jgi:uncharacterized pyridoxamine 5'-phosphate oxidase family protein
MLQKTLTFLQECKTFYLATVDGDKPRVRPFGLALEHEGKLWFGTANTKEVYRQLKTNPRVEISATSPSMEWIRLSGQAVFDSNHDVKCKAFELLPMLGNIYQGVDDPVFEVFYLADAEVIFHSFSTYGQTPEIHRF